MRKESEDIVVGIYNRISKRRATAVISRDSALSESHRLMMAGKVKAYTDVMCLLNDRFDLGFRVTDRP